MQRVLLVFDYRTDVCIICMCAITILFNNRPIRLSSY